MSLHQRIKLTQRHLLYLSAQSRAWWRYTVSVTERVKIQVHLQTRTGGSALGVSAKTANTDWSARCPAARQHRAVAGTPARVQR